MARASHPDRVLDECRTHRTSTRAANSLFLTRSMPPDLASQHRADQVRLKTTRPLGMVFISYFGEWA